MTKEVISIRELKVATAGEAAIQAELHTQVEQVLLKTAKSGKPFYEVKLVDAADHMLLRAWNDSPVFQALEGLRAGTFVAVTGKWTQNQYGIDARDWQMRGLKEEERDSLLSGDRELREVQARDWEYILATISEMQDPRLKTLCQEFVDHYGDRFRRTGAARQNHHARRGGLVEHVARMMQSALALVTVYPTVNRDLLVAGVLFHDCGKLWENCYAEHGFTMPYTEVSELLSHIPLGMEVVNKLWRDMMEADATRSAEWEAMSPPNGEVRMHLLHLIGSHHGEYEWGAPVLPKTPEAILLHHVDNIDAKLEMMKRGYETSAELAPRIHDKVWPLGRRLVKPLDSFGEPAAREEKT